MRAGTVSPSWHLHRYGEKGVLTRSTRTWARALFAQLGVNLLLRGPDGSEIRLGKFTPRLADQGEGAALESRFTQSPQDVPQRESPIGFRPTRASKLFGTFIFEQRLRNDPQRVLYRRSVRAVLCQSSLATLVRKPRFPGTPEASIQVR